MKIIGSQSEYRIYPDDLQTFEKIPVGTFKVEFTPMGGFYLSRAADLRVPDGEKVYGDHLKKVQKISRTFENSSRSLGVLFSGRKGIGKTLTVCALSELMAQKGVPTILVQNAIPGIESFIEKIDQEVLVIFDEFEKNFKTSRPSGRYTDGEESDDVSQESFLSLFDGISSTKRLYAITSNNIEEVSSLIVGRPGRVHYHIRYSDLDRNSIEEYLTDNLDEEQSTDNLRKMVNYCFRNRFNFDMLRALSTELNISGGSFEDAVEDLNLHSESNEEGLLENITLTVSFENGDTESFTLSAIVNLDEGVITSNTNIRNEKRKFKVLNSHTDAGHMLRFDLTVNFDPSMIEFSTNGLVIPNEAMFDSCVSTNVNIYDDDSKSIDFCNDSDDFRIESVFIKLVTDKKRARLL